MQIHSLLMPRKLRNYYFKKINCTILCPDDYFKSELTNLDR